ncbi:MAG: ATP-dependent DNA helicase RecG [Verrucomicrobia bacterium]|nr:ATP-dependent DNA helicase RecG [Verrucomicrobiota bacterium]
MEPVSEQVPPVDAAKLSISRLKGIGSEKKSLLSKLKIGTVGDLLLHRPKRYEDRTSLSEIKDLELDEHASVCGEIITCGVKYWRNRSRSVFECVVEDATGRLYCRWWNMPFMKKIFAKGQKVFVYGKLNKLKPRSMDHPETEFMEDGEEDPLLHLNRIVPIYGLTEGIQQRWLREKIHTATKAYAHQIAEPNAAFPKPHPYSYQKAITLLHIPESNADTELARERLALEEAITLQEQVQIRRKRFMESMEALPCLHDNRFIKPFLEGLPFQLTQAQIAVLAEFREDFSVKHPMRRLLQGDVGSGKTVVAVLAALMVLESGYDVSIMAPTTLLAEQHYRTISKWMEPYPIQVALHTGNTQAPQRRDQPLFTIGTHALIQSKESSDKLGMVIIDEQHKFGVTQRDKLLRKGRQPHLLVMTATPIPRTMGLTLYGDLDISVLKEVPGGRGTLKTYLRSADSRAKVLSFVKQQLEKGRQAYFVFPRIDGKEQSGITAVTKELKVLTDYFAPLRVEMVHGRMKSEETDRIMQSFGAGETHLLLATTVIEVGVDVPNATVMVIENAEQFGLAQLHQIRGRIGRGVHASHCILIGDESKEEAWERLQVLEQTRDGFEIAEVDFKVRGPGELAGKQQSGLPKWRFLNLHTDRPLLEAAREQVRGTLGLE